MIATSGPGEVVSLSTLIERLHRGHASLSSRLLRVIGPRHPAPPETDDNHGQNDQRTHGADPIRSPYGPSSGRLVCDMTEPGYVSFPRGPRVGPLWETTDGRNLIEQDQIGFPVRVKRLRGATDRGNLVHEDQVRVPALSRGHRRTPLTRGTCKLLHARIRHPVQFLENLLVGGTEPDERPILTATIRMREPCPGPEGILDLLAATAPRNSQGKVGIHQCDRKRSRKPPADLTRPDPGRVEPDCAGK
jgi:hypothetical protein